LSIYSRTQFKLRILERTQPVETSICKYPIQMPDAGKTSETRVAGN